MRDIQKLTRLPSSRSHYMLAFNVRRLNIERLKSTSCGQRTMLIAQDGPPPLSDEDHPLPGARAGSSRPRDRVFDRFLPDHGFGYRRSGRHRSHSSAHEAEQRGLQGMPGDRSVPPAGEQSLLRVDFEEQNIFTLQGRRSCKDGASLVSLSMVKASGALLLPQAEHLLHWRPPLTGCGARQLLLPTSH